MQPDIRGDSSAFCFFALPAVEVPVAPGADILQVNLVFFGLIRCINSFLQCNDGRMEAQLQNTVHFLSRFFFHFQEGVYIPGIQHHRLFTNHIRTDS